MIKNIKYKGVIYKIGDKIKRTHNMAKGEIHTITEFEGEYSKFVHVKETTEWKCLDYYDAPIRPKSLKTILEDIKNDRTK